ncbi:hypothetical protein HZF08_29980 [Paenibacillus sp. CGMCC 1.16610]|uniref:DUF4313 domain-containing protein n=1 Tax=Paenibacillus anseongense TaxID=2682845 RepID=A0ABW9U5G0_9BACL|nr:MULTISPECIES: hypothetical protein [Paenibacillus]MBA2942508.1 hypothetical protein [Paenibacillus sp. CGMCC 1.16610]MVQ35322.1 hypothetical protein [Paenibacillus anseongense]
MKKKIRQIIVGEKEYVFVINNHYNQGVSEVSLSISLKKLKNMICLFHFCTWDDPITGSPLLVGFPLRKIGTGDIENFNLHYPRIVKHFIQYGLENGWNGANRIVFNDGLEILSKFGYDVIPLKP